MPVCTLGGYEDCYTIESISKDGVISKVKYPYCFRSQASVIINETTAIITGVDGYDTYFYNVIEGKMEPGPQLLQGRFDHASGIIRDSVTNG